MGQLITKFHGIDIATQIGAKYYQVGSNLLEDNSMQLIKSFEIYHKANPFNINIDILYHWIINSKNHSWRILIDVLRRSNLGYLATKIEEALRGKYYVKYRLQCNYYMHQGSL